MTSYYFIDLINIPQMVDCAFKIDKQAVEIKLWKFYACIGMYFAYILIGFFAFWQIPVLSYHALLANVVHPKVEFLSALATSVVQE